MSGYDLAWTHLAWVWLLTRPGLLVLIGYGGTSVGSCPMWDQEWGGSDLTGSRKINCADPKFLGNVWTKYEAIPCD